MMAAGRASPPRPADLLAEAIGTHGPERLAILSPAGSLTLGQLDAAVDARAAELRGRGFVPELLRPLPVAPDAEGVVTILAHWRLGVTPAPLHHRLTAAERRSAEATLGPPVPGAQAVLWTSGSSGAARGVALASGGVRASVDGAVERLHLRGEEVWLLVLSPAHVGGLILVARALLTGAALALPGPFDEEAVAGLLEPRTRPDWLLRPVSHVSLVPTHLRRLLVRARGNAPPGLACVLLGGAHAPAELVAEALARDWPLALTYGATETTSQVATATPGDVAADAGTVGRPLPGVEVRIAGDGEILVRGPTLALGYVGATGLVSLVDEEGWYRTGDVGRLDPDGRLRVTGRRSDRIVSGGVTVDAHEVEEALRAHPSVVDACVVGLPSLEWGETVAAVVVPVVDAFDLGELERWIRQRLSAAKRPRAWKVERALPRNPNGKVDRRSARALFGEE